MNDSSLKCSKTEGAGAWLLFLEYCKTTHPLSGWPYITVACEATDWSVEATLTNQQYTTQSVSDRRQRQTCVLSAPYSLNTYNSILLQSVFPIIGHIGIDIDIGQRIRHLTTRLSDHKSRKCPVKKHFNKCHATVFSFLIVVKRMTLFF